MQASRISNVSTRSEWTYASEAVQKLAPEAIQASPTQLSDIHVANLISEGHVLEIIAQCREELTQHIQGKFDELAINVNSLTGNVGTPIQAFATSQPHSALEPFLGNRSSLDADPHFDSHVSGDKLQKVQQTPVSCPRDAPPRCDSFLTHQSHFSFSPPVSRVSNPTSKEEMDLSTIQPENRDVEPIKLGHSTEQTTLLEPDGSTVPTTCSAYEKSHIDTKCEGSLQSDSKKAKGVSVVHFDSPEELDNNGSKRQNQSTVTTVTEAASEGWDTFSLWTKKKKKAGAIRLRHVMQSQPAYDTPFFDAFVGLVIIANAIVMIVQYQWQGYLTSALLGFEGEADGWPYADTTFDVFEHLFTGFFILELLIRVCINGLVYFKDLYSMFDTALVLTSIVDLYILKPLDKGGGGNLTFMRFARILKFVRVLRIVRVMKLFSSLRILVKTIHSSSRALVWSMVLLGIIMIIFGMLFCQLLQDWIRDENNDQKEREWVFKHYGSSSRAVYTMFEATFSGCWPNYARPLIEISDWYGAVYVFYVTVVIFAIIRIITALFLKETLTNAYDDADMMINEQLKKKSSYLEKLAQAFEAMDKSGDGKITWDEFDDMFKNPNVRAYLSVLELEVNDTWTLFHLLDNGDGKITYAEFLAGVLRLKGQARAIDLISLQHDVNITHEAVLKIKNHLGIKDSLATRARDPTVQKRKALMQSAAPVQTQQNP